MYHLNAKKTVHFPIPDTPRARELMSKFGITDERIDQRQRDYRLRLVLHDSDIVYLTGPSGAGKSTLFNALFEQCPHDNRLRLDSIPLPDEATLFDCIDRPLFDSLETFSKAGLSDLFCLLQRPTQLSTGQQFRFRLAQALSSKQQFIFIDEFGSDLDQIMAAVLSIRIRKEVKRSGRICVLASCREDVLPELQPDILIRMFSNGTIQTFYRDRSREYESELISFKSRQTG